MKTINYFEKMKSFLVLSFVIFLGLLFISCTNWIVPSDIVGKWFSQQEVVFRTKVDKKYVFTKHNEIIAIQINPDGSVSGKIGNAHLKDCKIIKNRGFIGKSINIKTDFRIIGKLEGKINAEDIQEQRDVSMPFNVTNNIMEGSIFESSGFDIFPFADMNLKKSSQPSN